MLFRILIVLCLFNLNIFAQEENHCATDILMNQLYRSHPEIKQKLDDHNSHLNYRNMRRASFTYTIPVVFHIMHQGGPENISDAQVMDAVRILNRDYAKQNPDTDEIIEAFKLVADSTSIHFVLATIDPQGNCTNGIVHHYDTDANWNDQSPTVYSLSWNTQNYMNVYIVSSITLSSGFGAAGYAYYPGAWPTGDNHDAIVVLNNYFGSIGTGNDFLSRVLTHEVGHYLNLYHVFGSTHTAGIDCFDDDLVFDTPQTIGYLSCPDSSDHASYQYCLPGVDENYQNYMDYSYCVRMFTHEQAMRMQTALNDTFGGRNNLWSPANLMLTGVSTLQSVCVPVADFKADKFETCTGVPVTFSDNSWSGKPTVYSWTFQGASITSSTDSMPVVSYSSPGIYSVTYSSGNSAGMSSPVVKQIRVNDLIADYSGLWSDGFENLNFSNEWKISNSSGGVNWMITDLAAHSGTYSAIIPGVGNTRLSVTEMTSPSINLSTTPQAFLGFDLACADTNLNHRNKLQVMMSADCGGTWTEIYSKSGNDLITFIQDTINFLPVNPADWRREIFPLDTGVNLNYVQFKFVYTRDTISGGVNIYVDDVNVFLTTDINDFTTEESYNIFPNPSAGLIKLSCTSLYSQEIKIDLTDITGRRVAEEYFGRINTGRNEILLNENNKMNPGVYFVNINSGVNIKILKIIIE